MPEQFLEEMKQLLSEDDYQKLLDSYTVPPKKSIRLQLEKIEPKLWEKKAPFKVAPITNILGSYYVEQEKIGNHPYHHAGLFYVQEPSAMLPPLLVPIKKNFKILDLCAAPGGKTLELSNQVPEGMVIANEINFGRAKKLLSNVERLGLKNVVVSNLSSKELKDIYQEYFDVILIDAPCSGEGMFRKDGVARKEWSKEKVEELSHVQRQLLEDSSSMLKENGFLIYSTCTFSLKEDEAQIVDFLNRHLFKILPIPEVFIPYTVKGLSLDSRYPTELSRRCYPYLYGEGQFMTVLQKEEKNILKSISNHIEPLSSEEKKIVDDFFSSCMKKNDYIVRKYQKNLIVLPHPSVEVPKMSLLSCFVKLGEIKNNRFIPHHQFVKAYGKDFQNQCCLEWNDVRITSYLKGEEIEADVLDGYGVIMIDEYPLGLFKAKNGKLKNHYPKGLRYQS